MYIYVTASGHGVCLGGLAPNAAVKVIRLSTGEVS